MEKLRQAEKRNKNGTIKKGEVLNPNGRPKGAENRTTKEMRELIKCFIERELENVDQTLDKLSPKERLEIVCKLLPYALPKPIENFQDSQSDITISFEDVPEYLRPSKQKASTY